MRAYNLEVMHARNAIGDRIDALLSRKGWSIRMLANRSGVDNGTLSRIISGDTASPTIGTIQKIAAALGEPVEALTGSAAPPPQVVVFGGVVGVPLVRWAAHAGSSAVWIESGPREWLPAEMERGRRLLAAEVIGRCLSPEIEPGDVVIFDQNRREPQDGEIAVITTSSAGVFVKKVFRVGDAVRLYPDDGDVPAGEDVTIEGTALRVVKKLNRS